MDWASVLKAAISAMIAAPISIITGKGIDHALSDTYDQKLKQIGEILLDTMLSLQQSFLQWAIEQTTGGVE